MKIRLDLSTSASGRYVKLYIAATMHRSQLCLVATELTAPASMALRDWGQRDLYIVKASAEPHEQVWGAESMHVCVGCLQHCERFFLHRDVRLDIVTGGGLALVPEPQQDYAPMCGASGPLTNQLMRLARR